MQNAGNGRLVAPQGFSDFLLAVHHERPIAHHRLTDRLATHQQQLCCFCTRLKPQPIQPRPARLRGKGHQLLRPGHLCRISIQADLSTHDQHQQVVRARDRQFHRLTGLHLISTMKEELGDLDRVIRIVKVLGMVNAAPGFTRQPEIINGCSDLFVEVFGDRGRHARSAVGLGSLPRNITVEIEAIVEVAAEFSAAWQFETQGLEESLALLQGLGDLASLRWDELRGHLNSRDFHEARRIAERLAHLLQRYPSVPPHALELEILETSALEDLAQVYQVILGCQALGVRFSLDDFGTGYSSLSHLRHLPAEVIKIDQSFVRDMLHDANDLAIVRGVIGLAAAFRREVIAEGVETTAHGVQLLALGCALAQGYGIARPMPAADIPAWVAGWRPDVAWTGEAAPKG